MLDLIFQLTGLSLEEFNLNDNVLFVLCGLLLLYCLGYMFNFFQVMMERMTARRK